MRNSFTNIAFTPEVKAIQRQMGSRMAFEGQETHDVLHCPLGLNEISFIENRDSFYQSSVSTTGWPYVQHRGGPKGFLKVMDGENIGYADLSGNRQYVSVGNLSANDRVALIMMDYPNRRRLKIMGRVRFAEKSAEPELLEQLTVPNIGGRVDRGIIIHVEAWDWNCPQHITPRYTEEEIAALVLPLQHENNLLRSMLQNNGIVF